LVEHLIRKLGTFARLSDIDCLRLTEALAPVRNVAARTDIAVEGDCLNGTQFILTGWACRYRQFADGRQQIVSILLPGDPCEPAIPWQCRCTHAVAALTPVTFAQIPACSLRDLMASSPALEEAFQREALATAAIQWEWAVSLGCRTGIERLAHLLCELHARLAAVGLADGDCCPMPITQSDLGDALGQTSVHINRTLQELRRGRLIALKGRRLTILNRRKLEELAQFRPAYLSRAEPSSRPSAECAPPPPGLPCPDRHGPGEHGRDSGGSACTTVAEAHRDAWLSRFAFGV
jgi:CRP-like cAMP-binding protein